MIPTSTSATVTAKPKVPTDADAVVVLLTQGAKSAAGEVASANPDAAKSIDRLLKAGAARGKAKEIVFDLVDAGGKTRRVYAAGLGAIDKLTPEAVRQTAGALARATRKHRMKKVAILVPALEKVSIAATAEAIATGLLLASFDYDEYKGAASKKKEDEEDAPRRAVAYTLVSDDAPVRSAVDRAAAIAEGQNFARTIASRPGNDINPPELAKVTQEMAREAGLACRVMDEKELAKLGMGGILAVGAGSIASPPRMIVLEHRGKGSAVRVQGSGKKGKGARSRSSSSSSSSSLNPEPRTLNPLLVVGKAITFDTGGISIKPADKMGDMIYDKCGGMAVLGLMLAVARLKLPMHVVGILSSAENAISSRAYRPGDILTMYNGVTVEVTNTDAEGRLVLGDALAWGIETYKPAAVIDLATLTGGVIVALGKTMAGIMANDDDLADALIKAGEAEGEKMWRLPLGDDQREQIKSHHADVVNSAGRHAHPLQGGAFLSHFVPSDNSVPWAHLDIAGVADTDRELPYYGKGATGWGVRTLLRWVESKRRDA